MNPQFHSEFEALCALFHSGEITEEEWALLQIHLAYCDPCHKRFLQYESIASDVVPAIAAVAASEPGQAPEQSAEAFEAAEQRLMAQLPPSASKEMQMPTGRRGVPWTLAVTLAAACLIAAASLLTIRHMVKRQALVESDHPAVQRTQVPPPSVGPGEDKDPGARPPEDENTAKLRDQLLEAEGQLKKANLARADAEKNLKSEQSARAQLNQERDTLAQQLAAAKTEAAALRDKSATEGLHTADLTARAQALEAKVRDLNAQLEEKNVALGDKDRMLALDQDFLAHDRDIRDLIGARNLYIADIFDTNEDGKTAKPFGRVFYTKDRSLVFYGFDLDKRAGIRQDASFQAWGRGSDKPLVNLGLFYQDNAHKRWILRCNDAKTLARLDMVFVTVEPPGGSPKPTGKQLLRAYLQIPANHP